MFVVADEYRWNLMVITLTVMYYVLLGLVPWRARRQYLTPVYLKKEFGAEHLKATLKEIVGEGCMERKYFIVGHPDNGSGRYTMKAGYKAWLEFNKSLRIYQNFQENIMQVLISELIAGLYFPIFTASIAGIYLVARIIYHWDYLRSP